MTRELFIEKNLASVVASFEQRVSQEDYLNSVPIWERQENPDVDFPPSLLNVGLAYKAIENQGYVPDNTRLYLEANVRTQAFEAVAPGVIMETFQAWNEDNQELHAYGYSTSLIYKKGLGDINQLREKFGDKVEFEEERRQIELLDSLSLNKSVASGIMDTFQKIVISPYPVGADSETAKEIGYFADKGIAMLRTFNYDPETKLLRVDQIALEQTDLDALTKTVSLLEGRDIEKTLTPSEVLAKQIFVPKDKLRNGVLDVARIYDRILETEKHDRFFLGKRIGNQIKDYPGIVDKTKKAETETAKIVDHLVETHIEVAKSIKDGRPTKFILNTIHNAIQQSESSDVLLSKNNRTILESTLEGSFDIKSAGILIDFITKNDYLAMLCLTNPNRAKEIFDPADVHNFQHRFIDNPISADFFPPPLVPNQSVTFYFCGASLNINSGILTPSMANMSQEQFSSYLLEGGSTFDCPGCPYKIPAGRGITKCPGCGLTKEQAGSKCG